MRPHIVLWLIDDQGWSNIGYNNPDVHTPTMDKLSSLHGFRLTRQYSHSWCTPSRASLMTGRLPHHVLEKDSGVDHLRHSLASPKNRLCSRRS